jgi:hypothetical protein
MRRNPSSSAFQLAEADVLEDLALLALGTAAACVVGYLIYQKVSETAQTVGQQAAETYNNISSTAGGAIGNAASAIGGVAEAPYATQTDPDNLDPNTYEGYP